MTGGEISVSSGGSGASTSGAVSLASADGAAGGSGDVTVASGGSGATSGQLVLATGDAVKPVWWSFRWAEARPELAAACLWRRATRRARA